MNEILQECYQNKLPVLFSGADLAITFQTFLLKVSAHEVVLENRVKPRWINQIMHSKQWSLQARMTRFSSDTVYTDGANFVFVIKENSMIEETRQSERFSFTADECVICEILNPYDGETRLSKTVMDMSATGLSLRTTFDSMLFKPDTVLPEIRVRIDGELYSQTAGRIVYTRQILDLSGQLRRQVGIKFEGR